MELPTMLQEQPTRAQLMAAIRLDDAIRAGCGSFIHLPNLVAFNAFLQKVTPLRIYIKKEYL